MVNDDGRVQAFVRVARTLRAQGTGQQTLQQVVDLARQTVAEGEHAAITWVQNDAVRTPASTGPVPVTVDRIPYETAQGRA